MMTSVFNSYFWDIFIGFFVVIAFVGIVLLLITNASQVSQNHAKGKSDGKDVTTGHDWDGIQEYDNPLPKWWVYLYLITIVFSVGYLVYYPGFASFKGIGNWTSAKKYENELVQAAKKYAPIYAKYKGMSIEEIAENIYKKDDEQAKIIGKNLFDTYCIQCHGSDAKGAMGIPNLTDNDWLWGGNSDEIKETIKSGRTGVMAGWKDALGGDEGVWNVTHYVLSLNKNKLQYDQAKAAKGKQAYLSTCVSCHQENGKGMVGLGPDLTDDVWLWGQRPKDIFNTIANGHTNEMPAWDHFLVTYAKDKNGKIKQNKDGEDIIEDETKLNILSAYVYGLSKFKEKQK